MDIERLLVFTAAYLAVVLLPGPAVTALVARVLARGPRGSAACIAGLVTGALIWFTVAAAGLAALASAFAGVLVVIRYVGAACAWPMSSWRRACAGCSPRRAPSTGSTVAVVLLWPGLPSPWQCADLGSGRHV
jgi:threonine/homoserine/homoserine lactone efflux protein